MMEKLEQMSNTELKAYIKANRNNEEACHQALKILLSRKSPNSQKYPYNLSASEMEAIFRDKLQQQK